MEALLITLLSKMQADMLAGLQASMEASFTTMMAQMTTQMSTQFMQMQASGLSSPANSALGSTTVEQSSSIGAATK
eukprot:3792302-Ditylum_brightwellii.AAC.1